MRTLDVDWCSLPNTTLLILIDTSCSSCPCTASSAARSQFLHLLLALLAEFLQVDLHDVLDDSVHLILVLHHFCDVDYLLALQIIQEVPETLEYLLLVLVILLHALSGNLGAHFPLRAVKHLALLLVVLDVDVFAQFIDQDRFGGFTSRIVSFLMLD